MLLKDYQRIIEVDSRIHDLHKFLCSLCEERLSIVVPDLTQNFKNKKQLSFGNSTLTNTRQNK